MKSVSKITTISEYTYLQGDHATEISLFLFVGVTKLQLEKKSNHIEPTVYSLLKDQLKH